MLTRSQWATKYAPLAVKVSQGSGIFPETILSFAIVESQGKGPDGNYYPGLDLTSRKANNYFGIKAYPKWKGPVIELPTSKDSTKTSKFVVYDSVEASFQGFIDFLKRNKRYGEKGVFTSPDFQTQIIRIGAAGYEENPKAASIKSKVAVSIKKYIDQAGGVIDDNKNLLPFFFASLVIAGFLILKKLKK
jgi:flagellum-specific peptidoglycan hydrolase FlgJ